MLKKSKKTVYKIKPYNFQLIENLIPINYVTLPLGLESLSVLLLRESADFLTFGENAGVDPATLDGRGFLGVVLSRSLTGSLWDRFMVLLGRVGGGPLGARKDRPFSGIVLRAVVWEPDVPHVFSFLSFGGSNLVKVQFFFLFFGEFLGGLRKVLRKKKKK